MANWEQAGAPNRETDIVYQGRQVAALIGKGWH